MAALTTLFPVFFMLGLGFLSRIKGWITPSQKEGANVIVFKILFPLLILSLMCSTQIKAEHLKLIVYVYAVLILTIPLGKIFAKKITPKYAHFTPYLLTCVEGGNVALPLYLSIVGTSSNTIIFDMGGMLVVFVTLPVLIAKEAATGASGKEILRSIFTNSFVICVILGLVLNVSGIYSALMASSCGDLIANTLAMATKPIVSMILFILGYDLHIDQKTLQPILKMVMIKFVYYALIIAGFFVLFPDMMTDRIFMMAPIIYFMCPTGFGLIPIIEPLYHNEDDASFTSAFISMYMIITLIVYTLVVVFLA